MDSATFSKGPEWTVLLSARGQNGQCYFQQGARMDSAIFIHVTRTDTATFSHVQEQTVPPSVKEKNGQCHPQS